MARGLFHKAIVESGGSRDSVLTARPMREDGVDPNYPVSAETIGITFAQSMGIEGTDQAALAKLRALSADAGPSRRSGRSRGLTRPSYRDDADPRRQADHGNGRDRLQGPPPAARSADAWQQQRRYRRQPDQGSHQGASSSPGTASGAPRRRRPTILTERPIWPRWCRGPTTTSARPSRRASPRTPSRPTDRPSICYRFSYVQTSMREQMRAGRPARRRNRLCVRHAVGRPRRRADAGGSGGLPDGAKLLGQLRQDRRPERSGPPNVAASRSPARIRSSISGPMARRAPAPIPGKRGLT